MKVFIILFLLNILLIRPAIGAESTESDKISEGVAKNVIMPESMAKRLEVLSYAIDIYYEQMINVKTTLAMNGKSIDSPLSQMNPDDAKIVMSLANTKLEINEAFKNYKSDIETFATEGAAQDIYENLKFFYDIVLVKAFLPRFDSAKGNLITRIFNIDNAQYVPEIVSRTDALELFYKEFELNDPTRGALNSNFRLTSLIKMHNEITSKLNRNREANLYQTYPKRLKAKNGNEEAYVYETIIRGETLKPYKETTSKSVASSLVATKVSENHFRITLSCSSLFN